MSVLPEILRGDVLERNPEYRTELLRLTPVVLPDAAPYLTRIYRCTKDLALRNSILKLLADYDLPELEPFFAEAYARERHLEMKVVAMRGLAQFASEPDIAERLASLRGSLRKVEQSTPLNYFQYEMLLGPRSLPYLVKRYGYTSLHETVAQVKAEYERMPDAVKGLVTTDESGNVIELVSREDYKRRMDEALAEVRARTTDDGFTSR